LWVCWWRDLDWGKIGGFTIWTRKEGCDDQGIEEIKLNFVAAIEGIGDSQKHGDELDKQRRKGIEERRAIRIWEQPE